MHGYSAKSTLYSQYLGKFLLKSAVKKVRYGLRQSGVPAEIYLAEVRSPAEISVG
jgi:hypothetical protein